MAHMRTSSWCHYDQEFKTSLFTHPETTTSQSPGKISWKHSSWKRKRFCFTASASWWYVLWWTSISVPAGVSAPVFYPQHEGDPTQFDMSKVWCCGSRLAALLFLSEPIREWACCRSKAQPPHFNTLICSTGGFSFLFFPPCWNRPHMICSASEFYKTKQKPQSFLSHSCNHRLWAQHNLNHNY